jgi:hypothetical protein
MAKTISRRKLIISVLAFSALVSGTACDSEERKKLIEKMLSEELPAPNQELVAVIFGLAISVGALVITRSPSVAMSAGEIGYYFTESIIKIGNLSAVINDLNMQCNTCGKLSQFSDANENKIRVSYNEMASIKCTNPECGQSAHILLTEKEKFDLNSSLKQVYGDKPVCLLTTKKDDDKEETVLVWYTFNAEYISLDGVEVKPKGIKLVNPIKKTSYKLEVIGFNGKDTSELIVKPKIPTYYKQFLIKVLRMKENLGKKDHCSRVITRF